jgi:hypothetical protein
LHRGTKIIQLITSVVAFNSCRLAEQFCVKPRDFFS